MTLLINLGFTIALVSLFLILPLLITKSTEADLNKSSPFESGFDPASNARLPFSMRFFLVAIVFLIFDVEIALMLPLPLISECFNPFYIYPSFFLFLCIVTGGYLYEWMEGTIDWLDSL